MPSKRVRFVLQWRLHTPLPAGWRIAKQRINYHTNYSVLIEKIPNKRKPRKKK